MDRRFWTIFLYLMGDYRNYNIWQPCLYVTAVICCLLVTVTRKKVRFVLYTKSAKEENTFPTVFNMQITNLY